MTQECNMQTCNDPKEAIARSKLHEIKQTRIIMLSIIVINMHLLLAYQTLHFSLSWIATSSTQPQTTTMLLLARMNVDTLTRAFHANECTLYECQNSHNWMTIWVSFVPSHSLRHRCTSHVWEMRWNSHIFTLEQPQSLRWNSQRLNSHPGFSQK